MHAGGMEPVRILLPHQNVLENRVLGKRHTELLLSQKSEEKVAVQSAVLDVVRLPYPVPHLLEGLLPGILLLPQLLLCQLFQLATQSRAVVLVANVQPSQVMRHMTQTEIVFRGGGAFTHFQSTLYQQQQQQHCALLYASPKRKNKCK